MRAIIVWKTSVIVFKIFVALSMMLGLSGCIYFERTVGPISPETQVAFRPPPAFREVNLIGHWQNTNTIHQVETLIVTADHQFVHVFDVKDGHPKQDQGTWHLEQRASGCVYLHFEGMRYFYSGDVFALYGNRFESGGEPYKFLGSL